MAMFGKMKEQYDFIKKAKEIQKKLKDEIVEAEKGMVRVKMNGEQKIQAVEILAEEIKDKSELERNIKDAVGAAIEKSQKIAAEMMKSVTGGMGLPF